MPIEYEGGWIGNPVCSVEERNIWALPGVEFRFPRRVAYSAGLILPPLVYGTSHFVSS